MRERERPSSRHETVHQRRVESQRSERSQPSVEESPRSDAEQAPRTIDSFAVAEYAPGSQLHAFDEAIARTHDAVAMQETPSGGPTARLEAGAFDLMGGRGSSALSVQLKADRHTGLDTTEVQTIASQGTREGGGTLPYFERIQASFGGHDISGIRAHTGSAAREASDAMGAEAFATGNSVAFRSAPTLHTTAHEAAHIIQQRAGVSLKGGVGEAGDVHERHADAVAEAVVQGRSAEGLLDRYASSSGGTGLQRQVQRHGEQGVQGPGPAPERSAAAQSDSASSRP